jgi:hypothetical protein
MHKGLIEAVDWKSVNRVPIDKGHPDEKEKADPGPSAARLPALKHIGCKSSQMG